MSILTQLRTNFNLPVGDDYLYEEFGIEKPANYDELKKRQEEKAAEIEAARPERPEKAEEDEPWIREEEPELEKHGKGTPKEKKNALKNAYNWLKRFFGKSPGERRGSFRMVITTSTEWRTNRWKLYSRFDEEVLKESPEEHIQQRFPSH
ncbi:hypothetical protein INE91_03131 [Phocaeicola vulgatus]|nr:hypothetical protein [Phocaeicola vulgatus]